MDEENYYGFVVTDAGLRLITKLVAGETLDISRVTVGTGKVPEGVDPRKMEDLVEPKANGTSTVPTYDGVVMKMMVEFRSDLNGGLEQGFWLNEFGVFAYDPDDGEVMIYYATLGERPQYVSAMTGTGIDVRRFPVAIIIGEGIGDITVEYNCEAWLTAEDVENYFQLTILPMFLEDVRKLIKEHNEDAGAHPKILAQIAELEARIASLELMVNTEITGNTFMVTFGDLNDVNAEGVWNEPLKRMEF